MRCTGIQRHDQCRPPRLAYYKELVRCQPRQSHQSLIGLKLGLPETQAADLAPETIQRLTRNHLGAPILFPGLWQQELHCNVTEGRFSFD